MVRAWDPFGWIMLTARGTNILLLTVISMGGVKRIVNIRQIPESSVSPLMVSELKGKHTVINSIDITVNDLANACLAVYRKKYG